MFSREVIQKELDSLRQRKEDIKDYLREFCFIAKGADMGDRYNKTKLIQSLNGDTQQLLKSQLAA